LFHNLLGSIYRLASTAVYRKAFSGSMPKHIGRNFKTNGIKQIIVGSNVEISELVWTSFCDNRGVLKIGSNTYIGRMCTFAVCDEVDIGESVMISDRVYIGDIVHIHSGEKPIIEQGVRSDGKVSIGKGCWLGIGCSILPGVTVGKNVVVGANSVVACDVPDNCTVAGVPARVIRKR